MEENKEDYYSASEILNHIKSFLQYLRKKSWLLILAILTGSSLGMVYYYKQKPKYEAETTFLLEEKSMSGGGLASLASQFGINVGGVGGGSMFSGDNILNILTSEKVIRQVLLSRVDDKVHGKKTLADIYLDFTGIRKNWQKDSSFPDIHFTGEEKQ